MAFSFIKKSIRNAIQNNFLPCSVFCRDPLVLVSFDVDFIRGRDRFLDVFRKSRADSIHVFLQLGYERETPKNAVPFASDIKSILEDCPRLKITVLANTINEVNSLSSLGLHAVFCHQNAFLDETRYPVLHVPKRYDAIYIARFTPCKRHQLAADIPSIRLIGDCVYTAEQPYMDDAMRKLAHADLIPHISSSKIPGEIASARCGLCLSDIEGAMFVSAEYLLCGIPVVNTPNIGGRDELFPDFAVKTVPPDPVMVAAAVREFAENPPSPEKIRAAVLEKMEPHRKTFRKLLNEAMAPAHFPDSRRIPHKLLVRCTKRPLELLRYGLWYPRPH